jgi:hypothetical protein
MGLIKKAGLYSLKNAFDNEDVSASLIVCSQRFGEHFNCNIHYDALLMLTWRV